MGQKKLIRFEELKTFPNVLQYPEGMAGNWNKFWKNDNPVVLELACGKGEYAVGLGKLYPEKNFIGIDLKGNRIWVGAKKAFETLQQWDCWPVIRDHYANKEMTERDLYKHIKGLLEERNVRWGRAV